MQALIDAEAPRRRAVAFAHPRDGGVDRVGELLGTDRAAVYLRQAGGLESAAERGLAGPHVRVAEGLLDLILKRLRSRPVVEVQDATSDPRLGSVRDAVSESGIEAAVVVPLRAAGELIGMLVAYLPAKRRLGGERVDAARRARGAACRCSPERRPARGHSPAGEGAPGGARRRAPRGQAPRGALRDLPAVLREPVAGGDGRRDHQNRCRAPRGGRRRLRMPDERGESLGPPCDRRPDAGSVSRSIRFCAGRSRSTVSRPRRRSPHAATGETPRRRRRVR